MAEQAAGHEEITTDRLAGLSFRNVGPHRGGRVVAVAGHPRDPMSFYFGACAGGVWRTTDGGTFWECISDGYFRTAAVGAIAVADADPNVIYVGTGETTIRSNVSHGDGVYKSVDGGKSWTNVGLADTRHIAKIRVHPHNPDIVYVAALGHAWGPNEERGLYRSVDGGRIWERILFHSNRAGAIDLSLDPTNPRTLFCSFWEACRTPYSLISGGAGSGLYRSTDGGDTWTDITRHDGLPKGVLGKIGVAVSPAAPDRVWALVEADDGALFRSDNLGLSWTRVCDNPDLRRRAWYYMHIYADPRDADTVWVLNLQAWKSIDGGATFSAMPTPHGDNHDLWIDRQNPLRMIEGNDGGACVSFNGGHSWSTILNQPTAQFYHVTTDSSFPYRLYGSQQDNTAISVPSQSIFGAITEAEWFEPGGGESGYIAVRPDDPDIQYAGDHRGRITRHDRKTGQQRVIDIWPEAVGMYEGAESLKYRFQWTFPLFVSPHDPHVLYAAANCLFRSTDEGASWERISEDLTRAEPSTLGPSGGPITRDNTSAEVYATIFACVESPHEKGLFWAGTDDGLVHLSRDGGKSWSDITPPELKSPSGEWALISVIEPSPHDVGTAYLAATRYKLDDTRPFLYKTVDYGETWTKIIAGIPDHDFTRVIRADPVCPGLLFAGTETGLYVSFDDGECWQPLQTNLPVCPIYDLVVKADDLVVGTHGRSFWILDDLTPLRRLAQDRRAVDILFRPRDTVRFKVYEGFGGGEGPHVGYRMAGTLTYAYKQEEKPDGSKDNRPINAGANPPSGVIISYFLAQPPTGDLTLRILAEDGSEIRRFSSKREKAEEQATQSETGTAEALAQETEGSVPEVAAEAEIEEQAPFLPKSAGLNRFTWNFRCADATKISSEKTAQFTTAGPAVPPGVYRAELSFDGKTLTETFSVLKDPRIGATQEDLDAQYQLGLKIRDAISRMNDGILAIRDVREQLEGWQKRLGRREDADEAKKSAADLIKRLTAIEEELVDTRSTNGTGYPPPNVPTRLTQKLATLAAYVGSADAAPTRQESDVYELLADQLEQQLQALSDLMSTDIPAFDAALRRLQMPAVIPRSQAATVKAASD